VPRNTRCGMGGDSAGIAGIEQVRSILPKLSISLSKWEQRLCQFGRDAPASQRLGEDSKSQDDPHCLRTTSILKVLLCPVRKSMMQNASAVGAG
jgi:hypothetical protein